MIEPACGLRAPFALLWCAVLSSQGCGRQATSAPPSAEPAVTAPAGAPPSLEAIAGRAPEALPDVTFAWGPPCRVPARQAVTRKGKDAVLTFDVEVTRAGSNLAVKLSQMKFVSFDGRDPSDPEIAPLMAAATAMTAAVPTVVVSDAGDYVGVEGLDAAIDAALAQLPNPEQLTAMMQSPQVRAAMEQAAGESWNTWVGAWLGWDVPMGQPAVEAQQFELAPGLAVPLTVTRETLGRDQGQPSLFVLRSQQLIDGPDATRAMIAYMRTMAAQAGAPPPPEDAIRQFRRATTVTVALDPATARPHRARYEMIVEVDDRRELELRDTSFDWSKATGCAAAPASH